MHVPQLFICPAWVVQSHILTATQYNYFNLVRSQLEILLPKRFRLILNTYKDPVASSLRLETKFYGAKIEEKVL